MHGSFEIGWLVMLSFYISLHARADAVDVGDAPVTLGGRQFRVLRVPQDALAIPFAISFEEAAAALETLPRMFFEPDGSFVWASPAGDPKWQVDGNLFDRDAKLLFIDLKGNCPRDEFDRLLGAFGWPPTPLMFQLVREAVFLDEAEFRRFASGAD